MKNISQPIEIKEFLHQALSNMGTFEECALLDYPNHSNIGDHLIWLGELFYLTDVLKIKINYVASAKHFSQVVMEKQVGKAPILLHGGGNLGDLWPDYQKFREQIILRYRDRPIIILPQSIYFASTDNLKAAAALFNSHPNLTLFARENYSYELALKYFQGCRIIKAPDMAFQMVGMPGLSFNKNQKLPILYQERSDRELNKFTLPTFLEIPNLVLEDWASYKWFYREALGNSKTWYWHIPGSIKIFREVWQRCLADPKEYISRSIWQNFHPYSDKINTIYNPSLHQKSWDLMHDGVYQFKKYKLIITNRLHGHILCILLGIPHILLPNSYYKNKSFYETWTYKIPFCKFIDDASKIKEATQEIMNSIT